MANPKLHDKASRAGYRKQLAKTAVALRRETRKAGHREMAKSIGSQLQAKRSGAGHTYTGRVGVRKKDKKYKSLWHLVNLGVAPHVLTQSGINHPGFKGDNIRDRADQPTKRELTSVWWGGYNKTYAREVKKKAKSR